MRLNLRLLVAVLLLASSSFAAPSNDHDRDRDRWGNGKPRHSVPEPGSMVMLTLTAGTLVGGLLVRRRFQAGAVN